MLLPTGSPPVQCSSSVGFEPFQATGRLPTSQAQQHIVVNKTFSCYGRVTAWKMRVSNPDSDKWTLLQVWRRVGEYFQQVGTNHINITQTNTSSFTDVVYHVNESEQILYRPGDFIGVFSVNGARALPYAIDLFSPNPLSSFVYSYRLIQSDYSPTQLAVNSIAMGIIPGVLANVAALTGQFYTSETLSQARFSRKHHLTPAGNNLLCILVNMLCAIILHTCILTGNSDNCKCSPLLFSCRSSTQHRCWVYRRNLHTPYPK